MPDYRRHRIPGGTYFFTVNLLERYPNDLLVRHVDILRSVLRQVRQNWPFHIDAWVILPDHLHCVWTLPPGDGDFTNRWRLIKQGFSKALPPTERRSSVRMARGERGVWQRRFWEHTIRDDADYAAHVDYCHINPVKHGYVQRVADWPHSTFHRDVERGIYPVNWAGGPDIYGVVGERPCNPCGAIRADAIAPYVGYSTMNTKSTVDQIRERFDNDVERFSNLETGQSSTVDAPIALELITSAAATINPRASNLLDIGCGAGNYTLKLLDALPNPNVTLVDLSRPMLDRAVQRIGPATSGTITTAQADIRDLEIGEQRFDIIVAAAVFHHLRTDDEWEAVFAKCYAALKSGGSLWISDLIQHSTPAIQAMMWERYGKYLAHLKDAQYRDHVFAYIEQEDTPKPLLFQINLLRKVGFGCVELLHKNSCFAAFGAVK